MNIETRPGYASASPAVHAFVHMLTNRFNATLTDCGNMEAVHAAMSVGAIADCLEHTGGNVWVSQSMHVADDNTTLLVIAGDDSMEVCIAANPRDLNASASARWEECGEWTETLILECYA